MEKFAGRGIGETGRSVTARQPERRLKKRTIIPAKILKETSVDLLLHTLSDITIIVYLPLKNI
jgi:hypothetical protein